MKRFVCGVFAVLFAVWGVAPAAAAELTSIDITPADPSVPTGATQAFTATGTFSDLTSRDLADGGVNFADPALSTTGNGPAAATIGDATGDGNADLILSADTDGTIETLPGDGTGTLGTAITSTVPAGITGLAAADFNGDTFLDVAVANSDASVTIYTGDGSGAFAASATTFTTGLSAVAVASADFNGDGNPDLAVLALTDAGTDAYDVVVRFGPAFDAAGEVVVSAATGSASLAVANLSGTSDADIAVLSIDAGTGEGTVSINEGDGTGVFTAGAALAVGLNATRLSAGDLNGVGGGDVAVSRSGLTGNVDLYAGDGTGGFALPVAVSLGAAQDATGLATGDLNGDGKTDVATTIAATNQAAVRVNTTPAPVVWDSSDPAVATIDASGVATALSRGVTTITATTEGIVGATTLTDVNAVPVAVNFGLTTGQDTATAVTLVATDADGDPMTYAVVTQPVNGVLTGTAPNLTYTPNAGWEGTDTFTYLANDGFTDGNTATVTIDVGTAPVISGISVTAGEAAAVVTWTTDEPSSSQVFYGIGSPDENSSTLDGNLVTSHTVILSGLTAGTTYQIRVESTDGTGHPGSGTSSFATASTQARNPVMWDALTNATQSAVDNKLTRVGSTNAWNAGAVSRQSFTGDGGVELTVGQAGTARMFGLNENNTTASYTDISYAFHMTTTTSALYVRENGTNMGQVGTYAVNDVLSVERVGGEIWYLKNGQILYQHAISDTNPLFADVSMYTTNSVISALTIFGGTDATGPIVSDEAASMVTDDGAVITWNSDEYAVGRIYYGTNPNPATATTLDYTGRTAHAVHLAGLAASTTYYVQTVTRDGFGNETAGTEFTFTTGASTVHHTPMWTDIVNALLPADSGRLTKTASATAWDSGARSVQTFSGDGGVQLTVEGNNSRMFGLNENNTTASFSDINYAFYMVNTNSLRIYENGANKGTVGSYANGDVLSIVRVGGVVTYQKNGQVLYTSLTPSSGPLFMDAALYLQGATMTQTRIFTADATTAPVISGEAAAMITDDGAVITWNTVDPATSSVYFGTTPNPSAATGWDYTGRTDHAVHLGGLAANTTYYVRVAGGNGFGQESQGTEFSFTTGASAVHHTPMWTDIVNALLPADSGRLNKTASTTAWDSGARSVQTFSGDGGVQLTVEGNNSRMFGLNENNTTASFGDINYAFYMVNTNSLRIYENGANKGTVGSYANGDVLSIVRVGGVVTYQKNGQVLYTSLTPSSGPLFMDASLYLQGATMTQTRIFTADATTAPVISGEAAVMITDDGAVITWDTVAPATGRVFYGTTPNPSTATGWDYTGRTGHAVHLGGLAANTTYYVQMAGGNGFGQESQGTEFSFTTGASAVHHTPMWTDIVNAVLPADSGRLNKTASTTAWDSGARSVQAFTGDGGVQLTVEGNNRRMFGLNENNTTTGYGDINYAFYMVNTNKLWLYENGSYKGTVGSYANGDVLSIVRVGGVVTYQKNGEVLYTSLTPSSGPLFMDAALYEQGATMTQTRIFTADATTAPAISGENVVMVGDKGATITWNTVDPATSSVYYGTTPNPSTAAGWDYVGHTGHSARLVKLQPNTTYYVRVASGNGFGQESQGTEFAFSTVGDDSWNNVLWTNLVNTTANSNTLIKNTSTTSWDAGGNSAQTFTGDGGVEVKASQTATYRVFGLNENDTTASYGDIDYAIRLNADSKAYVYESGAQIMGLGTYAGTDIFSIVRVGGEVHYFVNGDARYVSTVPSSGTLFVDASIYTQNGNVYQAEVLGLNQQPAVCDFTVYAQQDTPLNISLCGTDPDGDPLTYSIVGGPTAGTLSNHLDGDAQVTYTAAGTSGTDDSFTFQASDGILTSPVGTVTVIVNGWPVPAPDSATTPEDTWVDINVLANDSDPDGDPLSVSGFTNGGGGQVSNQGGGVLRYAPNINFNGGDSFTYTVTDNLGGSVTETVTITVTPVNDAPVAANDAYSVNEDGTLIVNAPGVLANDADVDGDPLTAAEVTTTANGTLTLSADGSFTYVPAANWNGTDSFTYSASDVLLSDTATVTITVNPVPDEPVAVDDAATTDEDVPVTVDVLANDYDVDGDPVSIQSFTQGANGTVTQVAGGLQYAPDADWNGTDSFTYSLGAGPNSTGTVTITVNPVQDAPRGKASPPVVILPEDGTIIVDINDHVIDVDGEPLNVVRIVTPPGWGNANLDTLQTIEYLPGADYNGPDSFTTEVADTQGATYIATITIDVTPVNDAPVQDGSAQPDHCSEDGGTGGTTTIYKYVTDVDGDPIQIDQVTRQPYNGSVTIDPVTGGYDYTPNPDFTGSDSFECQVSDGNGGVTIIVITIIVDPVNDAPVTDDETATMPEDGTPIVIDVLTGDTDVDGDPLTVTAAGAGAVGSVVNNGDGTITYTPVADWNGVDTFTYTVDDGTGEANATATGTVTVTVTPVNDAPVFGTATATTIAETGTSTVTVTGSDIDTAVLTYYADCGNDAVYELSNTTGVFACGYTDSGTYTVPVKVSDGEFEATGAATVTVTNVAPLIVSLTAPISPQPMSIPVGVSVDFSDISPDDTTFTVSYNWDADNPASVPDVFTGVAGSWDAGQGLTLGSHTASHTYAANGGYVVLVEVTDKDGGLVAQEHHFITVYDDTGGHITAGGWYTDADGTAEFGFASVYPQGQTSSTMMGDFHHDALGIDFHMDVDVTWVVLANAESRFTGTGHMESNPAETLYFLVTMTDADQPNAKTTYDAIRFKIWRDNGDGTTTVLYDSQPGANDADDPTELLDGVNGDGGTTISRN